MYRHRQTKQIVLIIHRYNTFIHYKLPRDNLFALDDAGRSALQTAK